MKDYFQDIYEPLVFNKDEEKNQFYGSELKISNKEKIIRLLYALKEVHREAQFGLILEKLNNGLIDTFDKKDLEIAYEMYKQIVTCDVKSSLVSIPILRLSRD